MSALLARGAHVDAREGEGLATPLHVAIDLNFHNVTRYLLDAQADVSLGNRDIGMDSTLLHTACQSGEADKVTMLLERGADVHRPGRNGLLPLHLAARSGARTRRPGLPRVLMLVAPPHRRLPALGRAHHRRRCAGGRTRLPGEDSLGLRAGDGAPAPRR